MLFTILETARFAMGIAVLIVAVATFVKLSFFHDYSDEIGDTIIDAAL